MSSIDLSQFHQVFFEESLEGLDSMENCLLEIDVSHIDRELINTIFRAAHSIKGGSGTFGFTDIAQFTHVIETLLDEIRSDQRGLTQANVELFLQSVDCLRNMLADLQDGRPVDLTQADKLRQQFEGMINEPGQPSTVVAEDEPENLDTQLGGSRWRIKFAPGSDIIQTGNEPYRIIAELHLLGSVETEVDISRLPEFDAIDGEQCYLQWQFLVTGDDIREEQLNEVFEWVRDDSEIEIVCESEVSENAVIEVVQDTHPEPVKHGPSVSAPPPPVASEPKESANEGRPVTSKNAEHASIRVSIDKIDSLINMVGELVITQSMLGELGRDFNMDSLHLLQEGLSQLEHHTRELQENVMRIRMLPISFTFSRMPRLVRDLSSKLGKKVELKLIGENTELDKTVMEKIGDPLVHMVRNSLDHGLESPEQRKAAGKSETGTLTLNAYHHGGNIVIEIIDDGRGIDTEKIRNKAIERELIKPTDELSREQIYQLLFRPGFSTAEQVSDVSGRGVGMDVVKRNIQELNGSIEMESEPGVGSTFKIILPLTLAILDGQLFKLGSETYILPLVSIVESIQIKPSNMNLVAGSVDVFRLRHEYVPVIKLAEVFDVSTGTRDTAEGLLVVVEGDNKKVALLVDDLLGQQQVVIKSLESNYQRVDGISGATILGDGTVALILDVPGIIKMSGIKLSASGSAFIDKGKQSAA
ncbi:chemotaxis protein CheA [Gynuella sunshinyii]|uniref:Chemotaxis protein CheA n=1 Tax=Gynuella sunshinyii YC6258 TaxID=1445510 RepID=A0A0C5VAI3_9GAMM|nr:chemotaxis protein CheA [Gynuella sunshinyii]AJQ96330.1 chemotaxis protein histidine kinase and related kinase [Gynuella sunshinyii YC6258]